MTAQPPVPRYHTPGDPGAALALLAASPGAALLAGGTWLMRAPLRHAALPETLISLHRIAALQAVTETAAGLRIGALVSHDRLAAALTRPDLAALASAAAGAANPGIRRLATLGGNLCATDFAAADLCPALLALGASVEIATMAGPQTLPMAEFLARRTSLPRPWLLTAAILPRSTRHSAHERLPLRQAGDYPCAILSLAAGIGADGRLQAPCIAVGAVEPVARRWPRLEAALHGQPPDPGACARLAADLAADFTPRDGSDVPGWYRLSVLPALIRRAIAALPCRSAA